MCTSRVSYGNMYCTIERDSQGLRQWRHQDELAIGKKVVEGWNGGRQAFEVDITHQESGKLPSIPEHTGNEGRVSEPSASLPLRPAIKGMDC